MQNSYRQKPLVILLWNPPRVPTTLLKCEKTDHENFDFVILFSFPSHTDLKLKNYQAYTNILHIKWLFHYQGYPFLDYSCMQAMTGKLQLQTRIAVFPMCHCVHTCTTCIEWKLQGVYGRSTYWLTALLMDMLLFWFKAAFKIRLVSYSSKHTWQPLSDMPSVKLTHITWKL